jgi:molybdopterin molybdotransferase
VTVSESTHAEHREHHAQLDRHKQRDLSAPLMTVEQGLAGVLDAIAGPLSAIRLPPVEGVGRVLAEPVIAATSLPPWNNTAMDGYALIAADTTGAGRDGSVTLRVVGEVRAGLASDVAVRPGTAVRIATGAPIPSGADAVIPVEHTIPLDERGQATGPKNRDATGALPFAIAIDEPVSTGGSIRNAGSDVRAGATVLEVGSVLSPAAVALASGAGIAEVAVHRQPRVGVLATGDEVHAAGEELGPAGIPDANRPGLIAAVVSAGAQPIDLGIARDELDDVVGRLERGLADGADAIIVSGGVSVGPYDVVKTAFERIGRIDLWRVAVQPGKPFAFGTASRSKGDTQGSEATVLLFGLPGNPVSSLVTFELFVRPALRRLAGHPADRLLRPTDRAVLGERVTKSHGRRAFLRVRAERDERGTPVRDERGRVRVRLAGGQGSHVLSAIAAADGLAIVPEADDELPAGADVELWWLDTG